MTTTATSLVHDTRTTHHVALARSGHAPAVARTITARWLSLCGVPPDAALDSVLVVSELVTNSVRHTTGPCALTLTVHETMVDIAVTDTSAQLPTVRASSGADENGGRGLALLHDMGARVSVALTPCGKTVHATVALAAQACHGLVE
ncbi:ATP-binding protein [Streptomyces chartreusis]|uniref:ATP-binding protein n=1 Tax=Streptomyces chartreusis TaxID=1969 RepID=UPI0033FEF824